MMRWGWGGSGSGKVKRLALCRVDASCHLVTPLSADEPGSPGAFYACCRVSNRLITHIIATLTRCLRVWRALSTSHRWLVQAAGCSRRFSANNHDRQTCQLLATHMMGAHRPLQAAAAGLSAAAPAPRAAPAAAAERRRAGSALVLLLAACLLQSGPTQAQIITATNASKILLRVEVSESHTAHSRAF